MSETLKVLPVPGFCGGGDGFHRNGIFMEVLGEETQGGRDQWPVKGAAYAVAIFLKVSFI